MKLCTVAMVQAAPDNDKDQPNHVIAAIGCSATPASPACATTSGILGSGSDSEVCVSPLFAAHTLLLAVVVSGPSLLPVYSMLIDSGFSAVLIRCDLVDTLCLHTHKLNTPFQLGNTWGAGQTESTEWVKLAVSLSDYSWSSSTVCAIVIPSLCAPVILRKSFLKSNSLIEDHSSHTLVNKCSSRNLLGPPPCVECPLSLSERRARAREHAVAEVRENRNRHNIFLDKLRERTAA